MTGPADVTPERLAELADGALPETEAEREVVALMAEVRALEEPAPEALRARVRGIAAGAGAGAGRGPAWWRSLSGRRLLGAAAPVAVAIVALAVAIPAMRDEGPSASQRAAVEAATAADSAASSATPAAPQVSATPAPQAPAPTGEADGGGTSGSAGSARALADAPALKRAVSEAQKAAEAAGATSVEIRPAGAGEGRVVVATAPAAAADDVVQALRDAGAEDVGVASPAYAGTGTSPPPPDEVTVRATFAP